MFNKPVRTLAQMTTQVLLTRIGDVARGNARFADCRKYAEFIVPQNIQEQTATLTDARECVYIRAPELYNTSRLCRHVIYAGLSASRRRQVLTCIDNWSESYYTYTEQF